MVQGLLSVCHTNEVLDCLVVNLAQVAIHAPSEFILLMKISTLLQFTVTAATDYLIDSDLLHIIKYITIKIEKNTIKIEKILY